MAIFLSNTLVRKPTLRFCGPKSIPLQYPRNTFARLLSYIIYDNPSVSLQIDAILSRIVLFLRLLSYYLKVIISVCLQKDVKIGFVV